MQLPKQTSKLREGFIVEELLIDDDHVVGVRGKDRGGASVTERARIVIGAEGDNSLVARAVNAPEYNRRESKICTVYSYWRDVQLLDGFQLEFYPRALPGRLCVADQ